MDALPRQLGEESRANIVKRLTLFRALLCGLGVWLSAGCDKAAPQENCGGRGETLSFLQEVGSQSGLDLVQETSGLRGGPIVASDFDGDGLLDIAIGSRQGVIAIYYNRGDLQFEDVTNTVGVPREQPVGALAAADLDNDGDQELLVAADEYFVIYENRDGVFQAREELLPRNGTTETILPVDLDNDSRLDLVLGNRNTGEEGKTQNRLWHNLGGLSFGEASAQLPPEFADWTWSVAAADLDADGDQDLYFASDTLASDFGEGPVNFLERPGDLLLRNEHVAGQVDLPSFVDVTEAMGFDVPRSSMGGLIGDLDGDQRLDVYISNFGANHAMLARSEGAYLESAETLGLQNPLQENPSCPPGTMDSRCLFFSWGAALVDLDRDGFDDLIVANGGNGFDEPPPVQMYLGSAAGFVEVSAVPECIEAQGLIAADFDGDGDADVLLGAREGRVHLLENLTNEGTGLSVELEGVESNRDGRGAVVRATFADGHRVVRSVGSGGVAFSSLPTRVFLGVGAHALQTLMVEWPSGRVESYSAPFPTEVLRLREGDGDSVE